MLERTLAHLRNLVAFDTRNPPRAIGRAGLIAYLESHLSGFEVAIEELASGSWYVFARRGEPAVLVHAHLDTVPAGPGWTSSPFELRIVDGKAYGLGACDTKGAAAACLAAAQATTGPCALLFTTDEEGPEPVGVDQFLARKEKFSGVIECEPTSCQAVLSHRSVASVKVSFRTRAGHASRSDLASAVHQLVAFAAAALRLVGSASEEGWGGLAGIRLNLGVVSGGIKSNVVAPEAELRFGFRLPPTWKHEEWHARFRDLLPDRDTASYEESFRGPALPAGEPAEAEGRLVAARALAEKIGFEVGAPVDFWSEAARFSAAGYPALVFGPGSILQAHGPDEWVSLDELDRASQMFVRIFDGKS